MDAGGLDDNNSRHRLRHRRGPGPAPLLLVCASCVAKDTEIKTVKANLAAAIAAKDMKLAEAAADVISKDAAIAAKDLEIAALKRTITTKDTAMTALERESAIMKTKLTDTATETRAALAAKDVQIATHVARSAEVAIYEPLDAWVTVPGPDPATDITWGALKGAFHCRVCQVAWPPRGVPSPSQVDIMAALSLAGWRGRNGIPQPVDDRFTTIDRVEILDNPGTARRFALAHHSMATKRDGLAMLQAKYVTAPVPPAPMSPRSHRCKAVLDQLLEIIARVKCADHFSPIVPMFHGVKSMAVAKSVAVHGTLNFTDPDSVDPGYFGNGVYLTDCLPYAQSYADGSYVTVQPNVKSARPLPNAPYGDNGTYAVVLCMVCVGLVYPVTADDSRAGQPSRFYNKPLEHLVDSHFIPVSKAGNWFIADPKAADAYELVVRESHAVHPVAILWVK